MWQRSHKFARMEALQNNSDTQKKSVCFVYRGPNILVQAYMNNIRPRSSL